MVRYEANVWTETFCAEQNIDEAKTTLFGAVSEKFKVAHLRAKRLQKSRIASGALNGKLNAQMAKFLLNCVHGMREVTETKISGDSVNPLTFILAAGDGRSKDLIEMDAEAEILP